MPLAYVQSMELKAVYLFYRINACCCTIVCDELYFTLLEQRTSTPLKCSGAETPSHIESPVSFEGQVLDHFHHEAHSDQIGIDDASFQER